MIRETSIRYQLQPGRFRFVLPEQSRLMSFMVEAPEWIPAEDRVTRLMLSRKGTIAILDTSRRLRQIENGLALLEKIVEDVIERAELSNEEAEYLRELPHVERV